MTVKLASALPKDSHNGIQAVEKKLETSHRTGEKTWVVGVLVTKGVNYEEGVHPKVQFVGIESAGVLSDEAEGLYRRLYEARTSGEMLDIPEGEDEGVEDAVVLELEQGDGYEFEIRDLPAGRFGLYLFTASGAEVRKRGNLLRSELGEVLPGRYQYVNLPGTLMSLADVLISEWESNMPSAEDVVDAEVDDEDADGNDE